MLAEAPAALADSSQEAAMELPDIPQREVRLLPATF